MAWVPAVVASREEQLGDSEIKEDRIKDKETRQTRYRIQNEPRGSVDLHLVRQHLEPVLEAIPSIWCWCVSRRDGKSKEKNEADFRLPSWSS